MKKRLWIPLGVAATAAIIITALPIAIERFAESWLRDQGVPNPSIENVDFNPFTGLLRVESAAFPGPGGERGQVDLIEIDLEPSALFSRRAQVARLAIAGGRFDVRRLDDGRYLIGGLALPLASETTANDGAEPWGVGLSDASVKGVELSYRDEQFDSRLTLRQLTLDRIATWEPEAATGLTVDMDLDGAAVTVKAETAPLARQPTADVKLKVDRFSVGSYPVVLQDTGLSALKGLLSLDLTTNVRYRQDASLVVEIGGSAAVDDAEIGLPMFTASTGQLTWSGDLDAIVPGQPADALEVSGTSALALRGFALRQPDQPIGLLAFDQLDVGDVVIEGLDRFTIGRIDMQALELLRGAEAGVLTIAATRIEGTRITEGSAVAIDTASLNDLVIQIERQPDGQLKLVSAAIAGFAPPALEEGTEQDLPPVEGPAAAEESASFRFQLGTLEIGGQSRIRFEDQAITPVLVSTFAVNRLRVTGIDTAEPEQPVQVSFDIAQDDGATFVGQGEVWLFGEELVSDLEVALDRLDLTQLSSYLPGYNIQRGRLKLDSRAKVKGDALEVTNSVVIEKLKLAGKAAGEQSLLGEGMAMPLDVALDLLRDGDDKITLELPISGSLSDPQFDTGDIVKVALQNALQKAAVSYVKNALQPLGTILFIGKLAGKAARPRFEPVAFNPGAAELSAEARAYLDKIGQLMSERQGLSITFCGVSTLADRDYLISLNPPPEVVDLAAGAAEAAAATEAEIPPSEADLTAGADTVADPEAAAAPEAEMPPPSYETERLELARERGTAMHEYLVTSKGIDAARLFRCRPTLEADAELPPRIEIML